MFLPCCLASEVGLLNSVVPCVRSFRDGQVLEYFRIHPASACQQRELDYTYHYCPSVRLSTRHVVVLRLNEGSLIVRLFHNLVGLSLLLSKTMQRYKIPAGGR